MRPRKTLEKDLPKKWKEKTLQLMGEGGSLVEVMVLLNISDDLYKRWLTEEPEFSETIKKGLKLSEAWWVKTGRVNLYNKDFSPVLWYMNMKNRFGWKDRQDVTSGDQPLPKPIMEITNVSKDDSHKEVTLAQ